VTPKGRFAAPSAPAAYAVLAGAVLVYLALSLACWKSPGQSVGDTLSQETFAIEQLDRLRRGEAPDLWSRVYHGNTSGILMIPYLWLFGDGWTVMRAWPVLFGVFTLIAGYLWTRRLFGTPTAAVFAALFAVHPTFVFGTRVGNSHVSMTIFFSTAALHCLTLWWDRTGAAATQERRTWWNGAAELAAAGVLLGLGLGTKFWFGWFAAAQALAALCGFLAGSAPIWISELRNAQSVRQLAVEAAAGPAAGSREWAAMMRGSLSAFHGMLDGRAFYDYLFYDTAPPFVNAIYPAVFWAAFAWLAFLLWKGEAARAALPLALIAALAVLSFTTYKTLIRHHLFVVYPMPLMIAAAALVRLRSAGAAGRLSSSAVLALLLAGDLQASGGYLTVLKHLGAQRRVSDSIYDVAGWIRDAPAPGATPLVLGEHASLSSLVPLTRELSCRFEPVIVPGSVARRLELAFPDAAEVSAAARRGELLLVRKLWKQNFPQAQLDVFSEWARANGVEFKLRRRFFDRNGAPVYEGYVGVPAAAGKS
jgi:hypothetical protein